MSVRRATLLRAAVVLLMVVAAYALLTATVTTRQGLNYEVTAHRIPLYLKALQFVDRDAQYGQIAGEITAGAASDEERVVRVFEWTARHIRTTPDGWPVVDDHILNIIIRGHGVTDQKADVFATLATYAGVPAFWGKVRAGESGPAALLSFARVEGRWRVLDVANGVVFRTAAGDMATLEDVRVQPDIVPESLAALTSEDGTPYRDILVRGAMPPVPSPLRAELQMPSRRLWHELKATVGLDSSE